MVSKLADRSDKLLAKLDKQYGQDAVYYTPVASTTDDSGNVVIVYDPPDGTPVRVRPAGLSAVEISGLMSAGFGQVDAVWRMRRSYVDDVKPDHLIQIGSFYYQVNERGSTLDELQLLWTIITQRRS